MIDISPHPGFHYFEDVLTEKECAIFSDRLLAESLDDLNNPRPNYKLLHPRWAWNYSDLTSDFDPDNRIRDNVLIPSQNFFLDNYKMDHTFEIKRIIGNVMKPGAICDKHNDDGDIYEGKPEIEKHYSGLFFLNDNYEGGELYFFNLGVQIKPKIGSLVLFRGDEERLHGVNQVRSGYRCNLVLFWRDALI